ncbi:DUF2235 domain-containing protein [Mycena venus]|uniref:DUF2235 domain-containing protein n=1 Tax=Mycena venus TaxID=2733690 RepID=A0A8H7CPR3_9AGAR|nr:DUF2235 domain-containing protein [Mycena venus]
MVRNQVNRVEHPSCDIPSVIGHVPESTGRTLILCFDGTGDSFDDDNSNVVEFFSMLDRDSPEKQLVYYQTGIGTTTHPGFWSPLMISLSKLVDKMFAWNIGTHVMDGYRFLMQNCTFPPNYNVSLSHSFADRPDDRICLFGFSRGAYTARVLGGMLHKVGLLPPGMTEQVKFAYDLYARSDIKSFADARVFKNAFCRQVRINIEFIGVWDTVSSVRDKKFFAFTANNLLVKTVRHAVALDERRVKFKPNWWGIQTWDACKPELESGHNSKTDVQQVWFAGAHCDVGGGSVLNGTPHALSRIPLRWMIRECFVTKTGILFEAVKLRTAGLEPATLYPEVMKRNDARPDTTGRLIRAPETATQMMKRHCDTWKPYENFQKDGSTEALCSAQAKGPLPYGQVPIPKGMEMGDVFHYMLCHNKRIGDLTTEFVDEDHEDLGDCLSPYYDQYELKWWWKLLEFRFFRSLLWGSAHSPGERTIYEDALVHRSVKMRMESAGSEQHPSTKYTPRAKTWPPKNIRWVD